MRTSESEAGESYNLVTLIKVVHPVALYEGSMLPALESPQLVLRATRWRPLRGLITRIWAECTIASLSADQPLVLSSVPFGDESDQTPRCKTHVVIQRRFWTFVVLMGSIICAPSLAVDSSRISSSTMNRSDPSGIRNLPLAVGTSRSLIPIDDARRVVEVVKIGHRREVYR